MLSHGGMSTPEKNNCCCWSPSRLGRLACLVLHAAHEVRIADACFAACASINRLQAFGRAMRRRWLSLSMWIGTESCGRRGRRARCCPLQHRRRSTRQQRSSDEQMSHGAMGMAALCL